MRITVSDIREARDFAGQLEKACDGILNGETRTDALGREDISLSVFLTLIRGLRKTSGSDEGQQAEKLRHPAWQDRLMHEVTGNEYFYLPDDFEEALHDTMERVLLDDERRVIDLLYPQTKSYQTVAEETGLSENTVRAREKSAIKKLRAHENEFVMGKEYIFRLSELQQKQDEYQQTLDWMDEALDYLDDLGSDEAGKVADQPVSPTALSFYRRNGLVTLADVVEHTLPELFTRVTDAADENGAFERDGEYLLAVRSGDFSIDSELNESIGLDTKTTNAFAEAGVHTVRDFLALPEEDAFSIKGIGPKTVVYIYRRVLFG